MTSQVPPAMKPGGNCVNIPPAKRNVVTERSPSGDDPDFPAGARQRVGGEDAQPCFSPSWFSVCRIAEIAPIAGNVTQQVGEAVRLRLLESFERAGK